MYKGRGQTHANEPGRKHFAHIITMDKAIPIRPDIPPDGKRKYSTIIKTGDWPLTASQGLVRDGRITAQARILYLILSSYANTDNPLPFPSLDKLMEHTGTNRKTVQRHLKELETWGLLVRFKVKYQGRFHSTRYKLNPYVPRRAKKGLWKQRSPQGEKRPTSTHQEAVELVRTTPMPESPAPIKAMIHTARWSERQHKERHGIEF